MLRKTLTTCSLVGSLICIGLWVLASLLGYGNSTIHSSLFGEVSLVDLIVVIPAAVFAILPGAEVAYWLRRNRRQFCVTGFNTLRETHTILSFVGFALCAFMWAQSFGNPDYLWRFGNGLTHCHPSDGWIVCERYGPPRRRPGGMPKFNPILWSVRLPILAPMALFAILPAIKVSGWIRRDYRRQHGLCQRCGYDLRGSAGRCPECGPQLER